MKNISKLIPKRAIVFDDEVLKKRLILIEDETVVVVQTDNTDFEEFYSGLVTSVDEDGINIEANEMIKWEYIKRIELG